MLIGFYGPVANNTYFSAESFNRLGHQVLHIKDFSDCHPFSQPLWEDAEFILPYDQINAGAWSEEKWVCKEKELGWEAPYYVETIRSHNEKDINKQKNMFLKISDKIFLYKTIHYKKVLKAMSKVDLLIVCGMDPAILAYKSKKPFIVWPHGSDIRFAAGYNFSWKNFFGRSIQIERKRFLLRKAYKKALFIGAMDPKGIGAHVIKVSFPIKYFPLPLPCRPSYGIKKFDRVTKLIKLLAKYSVTIPGNKTYIFVPSRVDYFWKGSNILIDAITESNPQNLHFIFAGWGQDYNDAKEKLKNFDVTFLPFSMSKKLLFKMYKSVDLVVDQFNLATYGTSMIEAMSVGTPVMMYIDNNAFVKKGWLPPPVINTRNKKQVLEVLLEINNGVFPLDKYSKKSIDWFKKTHEEKNAVKLILTHVDSYSKVT